MSKKGEFINLETNGRLFPSWIQLNFKKYKLDPIMIEDGEDPCKPKMTKEGKQRIQLRQYQEFVSKYLDFRSPYKDILIYHGLGAGKTATAINVYNMLYNFTPGWNVFILIKASLRNDPWLKDLNKFLTSREKDQRFGNIKFIHYDSPYADRDFLDAIKESDSSKKTMYMFDEVHNFITNVYNNINSKTGKRAHTIYDYIIQEKKENDDIRVVLISATPAVNNPYELALIFNLLRPGIFPTSENKFNDIYVSGANIMNPDKKNMFQRRILGLVSYYVGATKDRFAQQRLHFKNMEMDPYQREVYEHFEYIEKQIEKTRAVKKGGQTVYKTYTRQSCNMVFPIINQRIKGENRPRPSNFRIAERDANRLMEGKRVRSETNPKMTTNVIQYEDAMKRYMDALDDYFKKKHEEDKKKGHTLEKDVNIFLGTYKGKFTQFWKKEKKKSELLKAMYSCSCKMTAMIFTMFRSKGPIMVFSNFLKMEGLEGLKKYMKFFGFTDFSATKGREGYRYAEYHGGINKKQRIVNLKAFNEKDNLYGKKIKVILISPAGSEGINLFNCRQVHIMDPYWNEVRTFQAIGRAIRQCGHKDLPMSERFVDVFRWKAIRQGGAPTSDEIIEDLAVRKDKLIQSFLKTIKEAAVDCHLYKNHNMIQEEYSCFQFNENSLFSKYIGPAYKKDIYYDLKLDNGLNSTRSVAQKVKVFKIQAVTKDDDKYSEKKEYWYNPDSGTVYDTDLEFAVGKVMTDDYGIPNKLDKDTYIIGQLIPIPTLRQF